MIKADVAINTYWVKLYMSGPIEVAKQVCRKECLREGLCVMIEPTTYIYTGGEESGFVIGLINYPRFPSTLQVIYERAIKLANILLEETHQSSVLIQTPTETRWLSRREA
jgi:hypothetical protein